MDAATRKLADELEAAFGASNPDLATVAEMDPEIARTYVGLARAAKADNPLSEREQALINVALNASVTHLNAGALRTYIAAAIKAGAGAGEIREVLQLTSVLGIHGTIPGVKILLEEEGGLDAARANSSPERLAKADKAAAAFEAKRGALTATWLGNCLFVPELVEAYADYSGVPWKTEHLPAKTKELVYIAIDLSPTHIDLNGARVHMNKARQNYGCTNAEIAGVLKLIALMGFQTHMTALPILKEELAKAGAGG